jgi:hypothetical protein
MGDELGEAPPAPLNRKARRAEAARLKVRTHRPTCACCRPAAGGGDASDQLRPAKVQRA